MSGIAPMAVLDGNRFYVADPAGDAGSGHEGLYADDTRVLRVWRLTVDGERPVVFGGGQDGAPSCWSVYAMASGLIVRRRFRVSRSGLHETLSVTNSGSVSRPVTIRYEADADFLDLFEVKQRQLNKPVLFVSAVPATTVARDTVDGAIRLAATAGSWRAGVDVTVTPGEPTGDGFAVSADVGPRSTWTLDARVTLLGAPPLEQAEAEADRRLGEWRRAVPVLASPSGPLTQAYERSTEDLAALRMPAGNGPVPAAGLPWFMTVFGRDTLITCLLSLCLTPDLARSALRTFAALQSTVDDPARDAQPGKVPHELRFGKLAALGTGLPYYGSADATPLYLMLAAETWRWTGDDELVRELEPALRAAMGWIEGPADLTGRGYVEFQRRSEHGLAVQTWKDSPITSMRFADGSPASAPLAVCEVQGYAYAGRLGLAEIARAVWHDEPYADRLERDAAALRQRFDRDFWVDSAAGGYYALALDGAGRRVDSLTSDIGHLLWTGIATGERADRTAATLLGEQMFSGWGVRTMSPVDLGYDPVGYYIGTVWPHDTAVACAGLARTGHPDAVVLLRALLDAAARLDGRLPEALAGLPRAETGFPVAYPQSSSPQAWAAAATVGALAAVLGLRPDRAAGRLAAAATVPDDLELTLRGVPALGRRWDVRAGGGTVEVTEA
ncbi:MAG TPA: glycogen debranching N-terminal domain-containing protein [Mycobacteriales bacterium]|nr:glycogen debranching N-terminal domain-containing protein [Mycobacteriales bacterium]